MSTPQRPRKLTTLSYALLAYLTSGPLSAYDLTKIMGLSGARLLWQRSESRLYKEFPNLVAHGLATSRVEHQGRRARTVYTVTNAGRAALGEWLDRPGEPMYVEDETLLKILYADNGSLAQLRAQLAVVRTQIQQEYQVLIAALESETHPFPERLHLSRLVVEHRLDLLEARTRWLGRAERRVASWRTVALNPTRHRETRAWRNRALEETRAALARLEQT